MYNNNIKDTDIVKYLAHKGFTPKHTKNQSAWYNSPLRNESTPSFKVDIDKNVWYDFGLSEGGNVVGLVCKMFNLNTFEAIKTLSGDDIPHHEPIVYTNPAKKPKQGVNILKANPEIINHHLILYLKSRKINVGLVQNCKQLFQLEYEVNDKRYFALGFRNNKGGYEIRNSLTKIASSPKGVTTINGTSDSVNIFEGFMDYLTALSYFSIPLPTHTSIILNGVGQVKGIIPDLEKYKTVNLFLDNDNAGIETVKLITSNHPNTINRSQEIYSDYKDFNDFINNKRLN